MAYPNSPVSTLTGSGITPSGRLVLSWLPSPDGLFCPVSMSKFIKSHPLLQLVHVNSKAARGGVSQITVPVQGNSFVQFSWGGFDGNFPMPTDAAAIQNAQFSLKLGMVPIGFFGMESILQSSEVVIPKLRAVMSDAAVVMKQAYAQALYSNNYANTQIWDSLAQAFDDGTNVPSYGGISRTPGSFWSGQLINNTGAAVTTRVGAAQILARIQSGAGGEAPDFGVMNPANWAELMTDFMSLEMYQTRPRSIYEKDDVVNAGFRGIKVLDTPIFPDPFCPLGSAYLPQQPLHRHVHVRIRADDLLGVRAADQRRPDRRRRRSHLVRRSRLRQALVRRAGDGHHRGRLAGCSRNATCRDLKELNDGSLWR